MKRVFSIALLIVLMFSLCSCIEILKELSSLDAESNATSSNSENSDNSNFVTDIEPTESYDEPFSSPSTEPEDSSKSEESGEPEESSKSEESGEPEESSKSEEASKPEESTHTHSYTKKVTAPTCTEKGYTTYTCSCGDSYTADQTAEKGHSWRDATCSSPKKCAVCGETSGNKLAHQYTNGTCSNCGEKDPEYVEDVMVWIPTNGGTKYHSKSNCSNMKNPKQVTLEEAKAAGFTACSRCH